MPALRPETAPRLDPIRLAEYQPPDWLIETTDLVFRLSESATRVKATLSVVRNPDAASGPRPEFRLDGRKLTLISAVIDGAALDDDSFDVDDEGLTVFPEALPADSFVWECETEIDPRANTALEGLYMSRDMFCSQCEAQGFRKITFYPDRPDVMSVFTTRIEADARAYPTLLSNGNPVDQGELSGGMHFVVWRDPFPKPCYLFALVAGDLSASTDVFHTMSGRRVDLSLFTRQGDEDKTAYALDSLKRSMRWDETAYGREYDLDLFMIVAVDDFNMGAMENKGLNIFNSKYVLASPETATDRDYELIESVVAHEYFHNWTGNRITCRDWFQLCLKEGLTVFRDQQFSEDERSAAVARIDGVKTLRARQYREDAGPLAHPVRPESYVEINNFYTATVYEKGAEIVRMMHTMLGAKTYRAALDLYFDRHDGEACTVEDFLSCFEDASGRDLSQFRLWWSQAGTPRVDVDENFEDGAYTLTLRQWTPPTPGQPEKRPLVIPLRLGLLDPNGVEIGGSGGAQDGVSPDGGAPDDLIILDAERKRFRLEGLSARPVLSINRGFSAPIIVRRSVSEADRAFLLAHDADPFSRWEAGYGLATDTILATSTRIGASQEPGDCAPLVAALRRVLTDAAVDPAFKALALTLPSEDELAGEIGARAEGALVDPDSIHAARTHVRLALANGLGDSLRETYAAMATPGDYRPSAEDAGKRALKNTALALLTQTLAPDALELARAQFKRSDNMSEQMPALTALAHVGAEGAEQALAEFYERWQQDALVLGKWFGVQATSPLDTTLETVIKLTEHPAFEWKNPNKFRALIGAFALGNPVNFHRRDGAGYHFTASWLIRLDPVNPQTTAKLASCFETWKRYDVRRQGLMRDELERIAATDGLSKDTGEMVQRMLDS